MAELTKLSFPANGRVVVVPQEQVDSYTANGWVEPKPQSKEAPSAKRKSTRRRTVSDKDSDSGSNTDSK